MGSTLQSGTVHMQEVFYWCVFNEWFLCGHDDVVKECREWQLILLALTGIKHNMC